MSNPQAPFGKNANNIGGIDLSLANTGLVILSPTGEILYQGTVPTKKMRGVERLKFIKDTLLGVLRDFSVKQCAVEGYSFGSTGRAVFNIGELGGAIRLALHEEGIEVCDISPSSLKAFIANNGTADKQMIMRAIKKRYKHDFTNDNEADAFGLAVMMRELGADLPIYASKGGAQRLRELRNKK